MLRKSTSCLFAAFVILAAGTVAGQVPAQVQPSIEAEFNPGQLWVTVGADKEQVRFTALGIVRGMRLEVLNQNGETIYSSELRAGSVIDWAMEDQSGNRLADGVYGCLVTVEDLSGQLSQRRGLFWVREGEVVFEGEHRSEPGEAAAAQEQDRVTVLRSDEVLPIAYVTHDGKEGVIDSGSGA